MADHRPLVVVLAGPNGVGKTTAAPFLLRDRLRVTEFVNADTLARGLSQFAVESVAFEAGRIMLRRLRQLADERADFAFETTLASRSFAPFLKNLLNAGYRAHVAFLWSPAPELNILRVADRVRRGGHFVNDEDVRRRYTRGISNFFNIYRPLPVSWELFDNRGNRPKTIAQGFSLQTTQVALPALWAEIEGQYSYGEKQPGRPDGRDDHE